MPKLSIIYAYANQPHPRLPLFDTAVAEVLTKQVEVAKGILARAYRELAALAQGEVLLFLQEGAALSELPDLGWMLSQENLGLVGCDGRTDLAEHVYSFIASGNPHISEHVLPYPVQTLENSCFAMNKSLAAALIFDEQLPSGRLIVTDLALQALTLGKSNYVASFPIAKTGEADPQGSENDAIVASTYYLQRKWCPRISPIFFGDFSLVRVNPTTVPPHRSKERRVFGSHNSFIMPRSTDQIFGLSQANSGFLMALFGHDYFDQYDFFFDNPDQRDGFSEHAKKSLPAKIAEKIRAYDRIELPERLKTTPYFAFHKSDPFLHQSIILRNAYSETLFPVTGVTHTIADPASYHHFESLALSHVTARDAVVCTSSAGREALLKMLRPLCERTGGTLPKTPVIPLGVDHISFIPRERSAYKKALGLPENRLLLLSVSRLCPYSKMDLIPLLNAVFELVKRPNLPKFSLVIAGSGKDEKYLATLRTTIADLGLQEIVMLTPNIDEQTKTYLFNAADVFISLSDNTQETFGLTILEAKASGLPVVASDWDGYKDLISNGSDGFLIPTYGSPYAAHFSPLAPLSSIAYFTFSQSTAIDMQQCLGRISELLLSPQLRRDIGRRARQSIEQGYSWQSVTEKYLQLWEQLNATPAPASPERGHDASYMDLATTFSHYYTAMLRGKERYAVTAFGSHIHNNGISLEAFDEISPLLDMEILSALLNAGKSSIDAATAKLHKEPRDIIFNALWLLKNNYIHML